MKESERTPFEDWDAYLRQEEPQKRDCAETWGLQAVDGLRPSGYLLFWKQPGDSEI